MALHKGQNQNLEVVWIVWTSLVLLLDSKKIWIPLSYHDKSLGGDFMAYPLWIGMEIKLHQLAISPGGSPAHWRLMIQIVVQLHSIWPIECEGEINQGVGSLLLHLHIWGLLLPSIIAKFWLVGGEEIGEGLIWAPFAFLKVLEWLVLRESLSISLISPNHETSSMDEDVIWS